MEKYKEIIRDCYSSLIDEENRDSICDKDGHSILSVDLNGEKKIWHVLSHHYRSHKQNTTDDNIGTSVTSGHAGRSELESATISGSTRGVWENHFALVDHWFFEDMANNLAVSYKNYKFNDENKILIIDDNFTANTKENKFNISYKYEKVLKIIKYKLNEIDGDNYEEPVVQIIHGEKNVRRLKESLNFDNKEIHILKSSGKISEEIDCDYFDICSSKVNDRLELNNYRYIFVDLLVGNQTLGFDIIRKLRERQEYNSNLKYEIIVVSRSTNTEDVQRALNEGASLYIPKERIFSIPYRLTQLGPEPPNVRYKLLNGKLQTGDGKNSISDYCLNENLCSKESIETLSKSEYQHISKQFRSVSRFPRRIQKRLQREFISIESDSDEVWIKGLPKADLHRHFGGDMDAEITLELSFYTALFTILHYLKEGNFEFKEDKDDYEGDTFKSLVEEFNKREFQIEEQKKQEIRRLFRYIRQHIIQFYKQANVLKNVSMFDKEKSVYEKSSIEVPSDLLSVKSPESFFDWISEQFYDLKPFQVTSIFNICLTHFKHGDDEQSIQKNIEEFLKEVYPTFEEKMDEDVDIAIEGILNYHYCHQKIDPKEIESAIILDFSNASSFIKIKEENIEILKALIQATHGNNLENAVGAITLGSFLIGCDYTGSDVLQTKYTLSKCVTSLCEKAADENIFYLTYRVTPLNFTKGNLSKDEVWKAFNHGYEKFALKEEYNNIFIILVFVIALKRHYNEGKLKDNIQFGLSHRLEEEIRRVKLKNGQDTQSGEFTFFENGELSEEAIDVMPFVSGFDLTGLEKKYPPEKFKKDFNEIFEACMPITIHAGEETESKYIWDAAYTLHADRIGHGLSLAELDDKTMALLNRFRDFNIAVELCPSSNFLTQEKFPLFNDEENNENPFFYFQRLNNYNGKAEPRPNKYPFYPLLYYLSNNISVTINTDDPAVQGTNLTEEYLWASKMTGRYVQNSGENEWEWKNGLTRWEVLQIIRNSFLNAFLDKNITGQLLKIIDNKVFQQIESHYLDS